jgi:outer membrane protein TolC
MPHGHNSNEWRAIADRLKSAATTKVTVYLTNHDEYPNLCPTMRLIRILMVLAAACLSAQAQTNTPEIRKMSLEDCIETALHHNLDVQIKRFDPEISRFTLNAVYGNYDPSLSLSGSHQFDQSAGGVDDQGRSFRSVDSESDRFGSALTGTLPWGLNYNLGVNVADTYGTRPGAVVDTTKPFLVTNTFYDIDANKQVNFLSTNFVTLDTRSPFENAGGTLGFFSLRQPLLKNFWIDSTRLQIFLDKHNLKISELELRFQVMNTLTAVEQAYYNLIFAQESVKVQQKALELAERLLAENKKRVEVGALAPLDEKQAEAQAAASRADLLAALGTEDTQQRVLKNLLSDDYSQWKNVTVQPTVTMVALPEHFDLQESWKKGLSLRPDLREQRLSLEKQGMVVKYQKNQLYPQLDLVGTYGYNASANEFSGALNQFARGDNPFWSYGAQMSIPLSQTTARNNYKSAKASKEQIQLQLKQLEQVVLIQIENSISVADTDFQRVEATHQASNFARAALEAEQKKLESGKSTSFEVLRLQRDLTTARSNEIRALADYNNALAQLALNEGTTLERRHVTLEVK